MTDSDNHTDDDHGQPPRVPFSERATCPIKDAIVASGLGRSKLYDLMNEGRLKYVKVDKRRLVVVPSLLDLLRG